jgi:hydrogenase maturation protease
MKVPKQIIVLGIGNPCRGDDAAGCAVVERLRARLPKASAELRQAGLGGLALMEAMVGYQRAFLVDAFTTGARPGTVFEFDCGTLAEHLAETRNTASGHDGTLGEALRAGQALGLQLPREIRLWGIEAGSLESFAERLTPPVELAVEQVADRIEQILMGASLQ